MMKIKHMKFEVCGSCQNNCVFCAHGGMISEFKGYQLSIEELKNFIDCTRKSDYFIEELSIHGIGEPLLWNHLDEGIKLLKNSGVIGKIILTTNGLLLDKIKDETMRFIDILSVSVYPNYPKGNLLAEKKTRYSDKVEINFITKFMVKPTRRYNAIPCYCMTCGPMFVKDKIFFYCGPTCFDAAKLRGVDIFKYDDLYTQIQPNYLENFQKKNVGNLEFCNYCWANSNIKRASLPHGAIPSKATVVLMGVFAYFELRMLKDFLKMILPGFYAGLKKIKDDFYLKKFTQGTRNV
ncbi:MAG: hypothetical protein NTX01_02335 [Candidatus Omnitrophica bacterium]|nr:hypothetical protein [Candidatus Omnitrophota bacterium]